MASLNAGKVLGHLTSAISSCHLCLRNSVLRLFDWHNCLQSKGRTDLVDGSDNLLVSDVQVFKTQSPREGKYRFLSLMFSKMPMQTYEAWLSAPESEVGFPQPTKTGTERPISSSLPPSTLSRASRKRTKFGHQEVFASSWHPGGS